GRPELDREDGLLPLLGDHLAELFLNAACSSGAAAFGLRGRGAWIDQPIFFKASQPRGACTCTSPSRAAIHRATFGPLHSPPSSGGVFSRSRSASRSSADRSGFAPAFRRRRSPS